MSPSSLIQVKHRLLKPIHSTIEFPILHFCLRNITKLCRNSESPYRLPSKNLLFSTVSGSISNGHGVSINLCPRSAPSLDQDMIPVRKRVLGSSVTLVELNALIPNPLSQLKDLIRKIFPIHCPRSTQSVTTVTI